MNEITTIGLDLAKLVSRSVVARRVVHRRPRAVCSVSKGLD
jgi:hypothetical protein